jgi:hypothetical protein
MLCGFLYPKFLPFLPTSVCHCVNHGPVTGGQTVLQKCCNDEQGASDGRGSESRKEAKEDRRRETYEVRYYNTCPHTPMYVSETHCYVSSYYYICVLILANELPLPACGVLLTMILLQPNEKRREPRTSRFRQTCLLRGFTFTFTVL